MPHPSESAVTSVEPAPAGTVAAALPAALLAGVRTAVEASVADATKAAYTSDWARFNAWCAGTGQSALPASPMTVAAYLVDAAAVLAPTGGPVYAPATLTRWATSINNRHTAAELDPPGRSEVVRRTLAGIRKTRATGQKRVRPLTLAQLGLIVGSMRTRAAAGTFRDRIAERRNSALLILASFGAFRESELVALDVADLRLDEDGLTITVRRSKTDQQAVGMLKAVPRQEAPELCGPCAYVRWRQILDAHDSGGATAVIRILRAELVDDPAMLEHVCAAAPAVDLPTRRPVFRAFNQAGWLTDRRPHRERVRGTLKTEALRAGLTPAAVAGLGGHSPRAGFVTEAFAAGAQPHEIARQTGHRDYATVEIYRRDRPIIGNAVTHIGRPARPPSS